MWTFNGDTLPIDIILTINKNEFDSSYARQVWLKNVEKWHTGYYECLGKDPLTGEVFQDSGKLTVLRNDEGELLGRYSYR